MKTPRLTVLLCLAVPFALAACDEPLPDDGDVTADAVTDTGNVEEDTTPDTEPDTLPDTAPDTVEDTAPEVEDTTDEEVEDTVDEEVEPIDTGTDCSSDETLCEDPYTCISGVCRVPLAETAWAEAAFSVGEPEELTRIFNTFKSFATDVKFMVLDVQGGEAALASRIGAADILDAEAEPILVNYQIDHTPGLVTFRPLTEEEAPLDGRAWITDPFLYELRATAMIDFGDSEPFTGTFGLDAEEVQLTVRLLDGGDGSLTTAVLAGYVLRTETEDRYMIAKEDFPGFTALFCNSANRTYDPGEVWRLSDVLDCNDAEMDVDSDDDGEMDAYRVVINARLEPAQLPE